MKVSISEKKTIGTILNFGMFLGSVSQKPRYLIVSYCKRASSRTAGKQEKS